MNSLPICLRLWDLRFTSRLQVTSKKSQRLNVCLVVKMKILSKEMQLGIFLNYIIQSEDELFLKNTFSQSPCRKWEQSHKICTYGECFTPLHINSSHLYIRYKIISEMWPSFVYKSVDVGVVLDLKGVK